MMGYSVNVPQNKMAYEVIMVYHLRMPFFIAIFLCFLKRTIRQDMTFPDFITFLRHHIAHIENQLITPNNWVVLGGASEKHVPL